MENQANNKMKNKMNIKGAGYIKENKVKSYIISFTPNVPIKANLSDLLFIATIPSEDQNFAPAYIRLQDKGKNKRKQDKIKEFTSVNSVCYLKQKRGDILVCAPTANVEVDLSELVVIFTVPDEGADRAPVYFKKNQYKRVKDVVKQAQEEPETDTIRDCVPQDLDFSLEEEDTEEAEV